MTKIDSAEAQASFPELLARVGEGGDRVVIEKEGRAIAVMISYAELKRLEAWEEARNSAIAGHAIAESDSEFVTMEEVVAHYNKLHGTDFTIESIINDPE